MALLGSVTLLGACNPDDEGTAGSDLHQAAAQAGDAVATRTRDVAITTEVHARLARDPRLSALNIAVHTRGGNVVLRGSAPDTATRKRASELVRAVDQVVGVNNLLNVQQQNQPRQDPR